MGTLSKKIEAEMQELRGANARLREQLAQKEDVLSKDSRMHSMQSSEMNTRIQELQVTQSKFDSQLAEKQAKIDALLREQSEGDRRSTELLAQQTVKGSQLLREKEAELESKQSLIVQGNLQIKQLHTDLASQQDSANTHLRILTDEKDKLQDAVDQARSQSLAKQQEIEQLQKTLQSIAKEQELENAKLGDFVTKSISAIKLASENSIENMGNLVITSTSNVGFASLTIKTILEDPTTKK